MFRINPDDSITVCCLGLLEYLINEKLEIIGLASSFPSVSLMSTSYRIMYCPSCGKPLKPLESKDN